MTFRTGSEEETINLGVALGRVVRAGDVVGVDGELGAGKTRLVRGMAEGMGLDPAQVSSPTYVLVHEYAKGLGASGGGGFVGAPLFHVDAYRLSGAGELDSIGWERVIDGFGAVVVEWAERIVGALEGEPSFGRVRIQAEGENERRVDMVLPKAWGLRREWRGLAALAEGGGAGLPSGWTACPVTGKPVAPGSPTYPFVDERARMADLGRWLSGAYMLSRELTEEDGEAGEAGEAGEGD